MKLYKIPPGIKCYAVNDKNDVLNSLKNFYIEKKGFYSIVVNAEKLIRCDKNLKFKELVNNSYFPIPDGFGAQLMLNKKYGIKSLKVNLPKLALEFSNKLELSLGIIGSTEYQNIKASKNIKAKYPKIKLNLSCNGFKELNEIKTLILKHNLDIILLGLGSPKQEYFSRELHKINKKLIIINCGGAIDILSGKLKPAPDYIKKYSLEWFYRLIIQPSRFKRYINLIKFFKIYLMK